MKKSSLTLPQIALIAATRVGYHPSNIELARSFHERLFRSGREHVPAGLALLGAKAAIAANPENVQRYTLFGDPLTRLAIPDLGVELQAPDTLQALGQVRVAGRITDPTGRALDGSDGQVLLLAHDSSTRRRVVEQGQVVEYQRSGVPLFRGRFAVGGGAFEGVFPVPRDITYRGADGRLSAFAWAAGQAALGARRSSSGSRARTSRTVTTSRPGPPCGPSCGAPAASTSRARSDTVSSSPSAGGGAR